MDGGRFLCVPFAFGTSPLTADLVGIFVILRIEFTLADSAFSDQRLDSIPLRFGYFHFVDAHRIVDVAIDHDRFHRSATMRFEWSVDTTNDAIVFVEGAVLAARTTTFPQSYQQHFATSS